MAEASPLGTESNSSSPAFGTVPESVVPGYHVLEEVYRGHTRVIYRGVRERDGRRVVLKTLVDSIGTRRTAEALRREFDLLRRLGVDGIPRAIDYLAESDPPVLVLDDIPGDRLKVVLSRGSMAVDDALRIAIRLAAIVGAVHRHNVVHKDLNPNNVLVGPDDRVALLDFSLASPIMMEQRRVEAPILLEGTLAYVAPEQTGRMNRTVDLRSDVYAFGVTLYEMLTGTLPFTADDPLELIHCHIARAPEAPRTRRADVPAAVSAIVEKCLAKAAEDRYQSAFGLEADLRRALVALEKTGDVPPFALGSDDVPEHFVLPQRLYGRDREVAEVVAAFDAACGGGVELVTVAGFSGVGKTSVIQEIYRSLASRRGYFVAGKFDQLGRNVPYSALRQAFGDLVHQWLLEHESVLEGRRREVQGALGEGGQVVVDVIPELALLIGPQPPVPPLGGSEAQNRFNLVFQRFLGAVARPEHPLVLFLDDLQWADAGTLNLLPAFFTSPDIRGLLVVGAYRDNEVGDAHPLVRTLAEIRAASASVRAIELPPLGLADLTAFVADALHADADRAEPLARLLLAKTDGNPFFVTQFLRTLDEDDLVRLDPDAHEWVFDLEAIAARGMTDNVVELMAAKIGQLPSATQEVVRLAACIGNRFDAATLATVSAVTVEGLPPLLAPSVERGLILPAEDGGGALGDPSPDARYRFLHDRVQQAAYDLIPAPDRPEVHLRVGRLLLGDTAPAALDDRIFEIVNHLNVGIALLEGAERRRLADLNIRAGHRAKAATAYQVALSHFATAADLLGPSQWTEAYAVTFPLHVALAECQYLCGQFEDAEASTSTLLDRARTRLDKASVQRLRIIQNENMTRYPEAVSAARDGLRLFGISMPETPEAKAAAVEAEIRAVAERLPEDIGGLAERSALTDPDVKMSLTLLAAIWSSTYILADRDLSDWIAATMVRLSLDHGHTEESATGYVLYGITVGSRLGDYATGHAFGRLAVRVNDLLNDLTLRAKVYEQFSCFVHFWREPVVTCIPYARTSYRAAMETGDFNYATYAIFHESWYGFLTARHLAAYHEEYARVVGFFRRIKSLGFADAQAALIQWGKALRGLTRAPTDFSDDDFEDAAYCTTWPIPFFQVFYWVPKLHLYYTLERYDEARAAARHGEEVISALHATIWPVLLRFYHALTLAAVYPTLDEGARVEAWAYLTESAVRLARWAEHSPKNFEQLSRLVAAEMARLDGKIGEAVEAYEAAIRAAEAGENVHEIALAHELFGKFWVARGYENVAAGFLDAAARYYADWGAVVKVRDLRARYPGLVRRGDLLPTGAAPLSTVEAGVAALEFASVLKAAEAIASEIDLSRLVTALMQVLVENAGADHGTLLLDSGGEWLIQGTVAGSAVRVRQAETPTEDTFPVSVMHYVRRTRESVVLADAAADPAYGKDPYIRQQNLKALLCTPIIRQGQLLGAVLLRNDLTTDAFTPERIRVVQMLSSHAAIALVNAELFHEVAQLRDRLQAENVYLHEEIKLQHGFEEIVGRSQAVQRVLQRIEQVAPTDASVLISGETGTGKELVARAIHGMSPRKDRPLITLNCGAIAPGLVESELFGHEKGAFTGAINRKIGRFELAHGGTIFLDEIGDLSADLQVKLLRVLQEGEVQRLGGTQTIRVDVRVIAATHQPLEQAVQDGRFRSDLYYRLNVFPIQTPPLRNRMEDLPDLVRHFVVRYAAKLGKRVETIPKAALDALAAYHWPGNIRELRNVLERSIIISEGTTLQLGDWLPGAAPGTAERPVGSRTLEEVEREYIAAVLNQVGWRVSGPKGAAGILGLKPTTLEARMKKLGIQRPQVTAPNIS